MQPCDFDELFILNLCVFSVFAQYLTSVSEIAVHLPVFAIYRNSAAKYFRAHFTKRHPPQSLPFIKLCQSTTPHFKNIRLVLFYLCIHTTDLFTLKIQDQGIHFPIPSCFSLHKSPMRHSIFISIQSYTIFIHFYKEQLGTAAPLPSDWSESSRSEKLVPSSASYILFFILR